MSVTLPEAIAILQEAQAKLVAATEALVTHNVDLEAHQDIRDLIQGILDSDVVYTRDQIVSLVQETIKSHTEASFDTAHPGWEVYNTELQNDLEKIKSDIEGIKNRLDGEESSSGQTDLEKALQAIEDKYAPILKNLQDAFSQAEKDGNVVLAEEYKNAIARTLDEKKNELLAAMEAWQNSQT